MTSIAGSVRREREMPELSEITELQRQGLSPDNPWPGLDPFDETDRSYFHGRAGESGELLRLVRREPLTVLFGRSGLGKTSLLKAGLFPLLREEDCLPVYLRLDHADQALPLREQIVRALQTACETDQVQAAQPAGDESLWSFFHRRDAEFWSERNRPVTPVIVFDQFEEIFTFGQETEASRDRSASFLAELGDLVENRPPDAVRQELEADPAAARRFDFKRATVKLVLSFREDFLAEMEGLKEQMPSLMYNRFRLLAMSGAQAYEVITRAGGHLVDDDVARRIIRLAWKNEPSPPVAAADFPRIEIDPALLSVVCSELNHKRQQAKPPLERITPALLEGADREILSGFYERSMAGLDPRVRAFVEDELITDRGYRDSHALEDALSLPGITSEALDALIRRRLLRVDERQSVRRLELTHDVLTRVVKDSRDSRRAREAEEAAEARERAAREQQRRNRRNAALVGAGAFVVVVLIVLAAGLVVVARRAERQAADAREQATTLAKRADEQSRRADKAANQAMAQQGRTDIEAAKARQEQERATALGRQAEDQKHRAAELLHEAESSRLMANADRLQDPSYDASLLVNLEAIRAAPTLDAEAGLLRRFESHPRLAGFLPGHEDTVVGAAFSPDGKRLALASGDDVVLWDVDSHKPLATLDRHVGAVTGVAFSPVGRLLASASEDKTVILWDVDSHSLLARLTGHGKEVYGVAFSRDGERLASAGGDETVIVWDVQSRNPLATLRGHAQWVSGVAFSRDGKRLASSSWDHTVRLWDVAGGTLQRTLTGHTDVVSSVAFSPDGNLLASAGRDREVRLWSADSGAWQATLPHGDAVSSIAFSPDGKRLASASGDKSILWDVEKQVPLASLEGHKGGVYSVGFSRDGKWLASAGEDKAAILWDLHGGKLYTALSGHKGPVLKVAFSPDGKRLASASADKTVILWDVTSRKPSATLSGHRGEVWDVVFSRDGQRLTSASQYGTVILWDVEGGKLSTQERSGGTGVAFSPDRKRLAWMRDKEIILWDAGGKPQSTLAEHTQTIRGVTFSPDGKRLASASEDETIIVWDVESGKRQARLEGHKNIVADVAFSPDGKHLASGSWDETVIVWDLDRGKPQATLTGHEGVVLSVAFSPDGKRLASGSEDRTVILWDVDRRKPLARLEGHEDVILSVAFSPDGKRLASAGREHFNVTLWDLDREILMAEACRTASRNLTCEEWRSYVGTDKPYHKTCAGLPGPERCD